LEDTPSFLSEPCSAEKVYYHENVFVGYRYYDKKKMPVQFPFGFGLSYTTFAYSDFRVSSTELLDTETLEVSVRVTNTGDRVGKEVVQVYVTNGARGEFTPEKELKGFEKIFLNPGESRTVRITLDKRSFACYQECVHDWEVLEGKYRILVGKSSREILFETEIGVKPAVAPAPMPVHPNTAIGELLQDARTKDAVYTATKRLIGQFADGSEAAAQAITEQMVNALLENYPIRALKNFNGVPQEEIDAIVRQMNELLRA